MSIVSYRFFSLTPSDPTTGRLDFHGPMVNRSARIADTGYGGQVVISGTAKKYVTPESLAPFQQELGDLPQFLSRGSFTLKGVSEPEEVLEVVHPKISHREFTGLRHDSKALSGSEETLPPLKKKKNWFKVLMNILVVVPSPFTTYSSHSLAESGHVQTRGGCHRVKRSVRFHCVESISFSLYRFFLFFYRSTWA